MADTTEKRGNCYVYGIVIDNRSGAAPCLRYVGKGTDSQSGRRFKAHMCKARKRLEARKQGKSLKPHKLYNGMASAIEQGYEISSVIIRDGLDDEAAFQLERELIAALHPEQPKLRWNTAEGGLGITSALAKKMWEDEDFRRRHSESRIGYTHSRETRDRIGAAHKGRVYSDETIRKMSASKKGHPGRTWSEEQRKDLSEIKKGRPHRDEVRKKIADNNIRRSKAVVTPNGIYESVLAAARAHGIDKTTGSYRARNQSGGWYFVDEEQLPEKANRRFRPVLTPEGPFESVSAAARAHGISASHARQRAIGQLFGWRYAGAEPSTEPQRRQGNPRPVITPNGQFESLTAAAKAYGITLTATSLRAKKQIMGFRYADTEPLPPKPSLQSIRHIITPLGRFESVPAAARAHGIAFNTVVYRARKQRMGFRYADTEPSPLKPDLRSRSLVTPLGHFASAAAAARAHGISHPTAKRRAEKQIKGFRFADSQPSTSEPDTSPAILKAA